MAQEFEGDLRGAQFWGADLQGARLRDVNLTDVSITHARLVDTQVDAFVDRLVVNGVDVTAYVNEHDHWYPARAALGASDPATMQAGWDALRQAWVATTERARRLPAEAQHRNVDGEWSFVQTLRHLVLATDKWFAAPLVGQEFHSFGMPDTGSIDFPWPGLDRDASPTVEEVLAARDEQAAQLSGYLATVTEDELARTVDILQNGPHEVRSCIGTVLEEEFWHLRYLDRDLTTIEAGG